MVDEEDSDEDQGDNDPDDDEPTRNPSAFGGRTTTSQDVGRVLVTDADGIDDADGEEEDDGEDDDDDDDEIEYDIAVEEDNEDPANASVDGEHDGEQDDGQDGDQDGNQDGDQDGDQNTSQYDADDDENRPLVFDNTRDTADTMDDADDRPVGYEDDDDDDLDDDDDQDDNDADDTNVARNASEEKYEDDDEADDDNNNDDEEQDDDDDDEREDVGGQGAENTGLTDQENMEFDGDGPFEDDDLEDDDDDDNDNENLSGLDNVIGQAPGGELPPEEFLDQPVEDISVQQTPVEYDAEQAHALLEVATERREGGEDGNNLKSLSAQNLAIPITGKRAGHSLAPEGNKEYLNDGESRKGAENDMNGIEDQERERKKARIA